MDIEMAYQYIDRTGADPAIAQTLTITAMHKSIPLHITWNSFATNNPGVDAELPYCTDASSPISMINYLCKTATNVNMLEGDISLRFKQYTDHQQSGADDIMLEPEASE
jgi:hypothetical protein